MNRTIGIVRETDEIGRIVFPAELLRRLSINHGDELEFYINESTLVLQLYTGGGCLFCFSSEHVHLFKGKFICNNCVTEMVSHKPDMFPSKTTATNMEHQKHDPGSAQNTRVRQTRKEMVERLQDLLREHPRATQKELAAMLHISTPRINQLMKHVTK